MHSTLTASIQVVAGSEFRYLPRMAEGKSIFIRKEKEKRSEWVVGGSGLADLSGRHHR